MRLTQYSDYALRMLIYAALHPGELVTIAEISKAYGISKNHLMKVANTLSQAGYLKAIRGRKGGLTLGKPANAITVGEVVRLTESGSVFVECADPTTNACVITRSCNLKHVLRDALSEFYKRLDRATLADMVDEPKSLLRLLPKDVA